MKHTIHAKLTETFALINELGDAEARVAFSLDLTYLHGEYMGRVKAAEECCDECLKATSANNAVKLIAELDNLKMDVDLSARNARIGLFWWSFTRHDSKHTN